MTVWRIVLLVALIVGARSEECPVLLSVLVCCANVPDKDPFPGHDRSDPYCEVSAGGHKSKTSTIHNDNKPIWNEELEIGCVDLDSVITVHCYDEDVGKDDSLIDERLYEWSDGGSYRLGGTSHWVDIEVSATLPPTSVPTPAPTPLVSKNDVEDVQRAESREGDRQGGCFDSPLLGQYVELDDVTITHVDNSSFFVAVGNSAAPWEGVRVSSGEARPQISACGTVKGVVDEQNGETVLIDADFVASGTSCFVEPMAVSTGMIASSCGSVEAESLEGVDVVVSGESRLSFFQDTSRLQIDDGSGPAFLVDGLSPTALDQQEEDVFVSSVTGIVRYVQNRYGLSVIAHGEIRHQKPLATLVPTPGPQPVADSVRHDGAAPAFVAAIFVSAVALIAILAGVYLRANGLTFSGRSRLRYYHRGGRNEVSERTYELTGFGGSLDDDDDDDTLRTPNPLRDEALDQRQ